MGTDGCDAALHGQDISATNQLARSVQISQTGPDVQRAAEMPALCLASCA